MNILGVVADKVGACEVYRTIYPFNSLAKRGHSINILKSTQFYDAVKEGKMPWKGADLITFQRLQLPKDIDINAFNDVSRLLRKIGVSTIIDYDDDYTNKYRKVHDGLIPDISGFSAVTVTGPFLKHVMSKYNKHVYILPNAVQPEILAGFKRIDSLEGKTIIGLTGSATHRVDWKTVVEPVLAIAKERKDVLVFVTGYVPDELLGKPGVITLKDLDSSIDAPDHNFFVPIQQYGAILRQIDILLCPVDPMDKFNWSKSNLKAIEGQASARAIGSETGGCAVIATGDLPIYRDAVTNNETGLLVEHNNQKRWYDSIIRLLDNPDFMRRIQVNGYKSCMRTFTVDSRAREREAAYLDIYDRDRVAALARNGG